MICRNCDKKIPDAVIFCPFCGSKCAKKQCIACGAELKEEQLSCHACGLKLSGEAPKNTKSSQKVEITNSGYVGEKHPVDSGVAVWLKKAGILSVVSLFVVFVVALRLITRALSSRYGSGLEDTRGLGYLASMELAHIIYIRYKFIHKNKDMTIADAIISTVMIATAPLLVLILYLLGGI